MDKAGMSVARISHRNMKIIATTMITDAMQADHIIRSGQADLVLLARELLRHPYWAYDAAVAVHKKDALKRPVQYSAV